MLEFKNIEIVDKEWIDRIMRLSDYRGSEYCFTNLFIWDGIYKTKISRFKDFLILRTGTEGYRQYLYPPGRGDRREVIEIMMEDAKNDESDFSLIGLTRETREELDKLFPHTFRFTPVRDSYDYIYESDKMINLTGKKLQPKRNHLNFFTSNYKWSLETISVDLIPEVKEFSREWCRRMDCKRTETLQWESCAVEKCLDNYGSLNLTGGVLWADGEIVAFSVGEVISSDTVIIHIEKAFSDVRGAYPMINREFAKLLASGHTYINREDDIGDEGLRKAKESYYPAFMLEKFTAKLF